jgi:hypothetical protein
VVLDGTELGVALTVVTAGALELRGTELLTTIELLGTELLGAELLGVLLFGVELLGAELLGVLLFGVELLGAELLGVLLFDVELFGADLLGAELLGTELLAGLESSEPRPRLAEAGLIKTAVETAIPTATVAAVLNIRRLFVLCLMFMFAPWFL